MRKKYIINVFFETIRMLVKLNVSWLVDIDTIMILG